MEIEEINLKDDDIILDRIKNKKEKKIDVEDDIEKDIDIDVNNIKIDEEDEEKIKYIKHILSYKNDDMFKEELSDIPGELKHYDISSLKKILKEIKERIATSDPMIEQGIIMGVNLIENLGVGKGFQLQGLTNVVIANRTSKRAIREISIDMGQRTKLTPEQRLMSVIITSSVGLHTFNSRKEEKKKELGLNEEVSEHVEEEFKDL